MDEQVGRQAPRVLTEALDASARDLAAGWVGDADAAQREARRLLKAFEQARAGAKGGRCLGLSRAVALHRAGGRLCEGN